jgi:NhaP-type Na+/H+ or K+/H+ antiporter
MHISLLLLFAFGWLMLGGSCITASIVIRRLRVWAIPMILTFGAIPAVAAVVLLRNR